MSIFHTPEEHKAYIEQRKDEIATAIFDTTHAALYKLFSARDDAKGISYTSEQYEGDKNFILLNFKDGLGFKVTVELDHEPIF